MESERGRGQTAGGGKSPEYLVDDPGDDSALLVGPRVARHGERLARARLEGRYISKRPGRALEATGGVTWP